MINLNLLLSTCSSLSKWVLWYCHPTSNRFLFPTYMAIWYGNAAIRLVCPRTHL